jgi:hypothetical protein
MQFGHTSSTRDADVCQKGNRLIPRNFSLQPREPSSNVQRRGLRLAFTSGSRALRLDIFAGLASVLNFQLAAT